MSFYFYLTPCPRNPPDLSSYSPTLLLFYPCLILIWGLLVFIGRPLALHLFCCVMNKCLLSMSPCHVFFCGTPAKHRAKERGGRGVASHYFIAAEQQCVPWRLKKLNAEASFPVFCLSQSVYFFLSHLLLHMSLFFSLLLICLNYNSLTSLPVVQTQTDKHTHYQTLSCSERLCVQRPNYPTTLVYISVGEEWQWTVLKLK